MEINVKKLPVWKKQIRLRRGGKRKYGKRKYHKTVPLQFHQMFTMFVARQQ